MRKRGLAAGVGIVLLAGAVAAFGKEPLLECGSYFVKAQEERFLHLRHSIRRAATRLAAAEAGPRAARANQDIGEIAVIGAGNGVVGARNPFDLLSKTVTFTPEAGGYKVAAGTDTFDSAAAQSGTRLPLEDDDTERISLPFAFPFYGATYNDAWVNSNGSVTFTRGDLDYSGSFGHFVAGPPSIAGLFTDLHPPTSTNGVRVLREAARVVVTWDNVPLVGDSVFNPGQTFQIRLYPDGKIEFTYTSASPNLDRTLVGLTPGNTQTVALGDLTSTTATFPTGIAESFTSSLAPSIDVIAASQRFYETHGDAYDYLVFYNALGVPADTGVVAYELTTRSSGDGYGDVPVDVGAEYGSKRELQAVLNMGPVTQYPANPFGTVPSRGVIGDTPVSILAHEAGHLFLALVSVPSPTGTTFPPMLGAGLAHWAFPFHTDASVMEGNRIEDLGPTANPRFRTTATVQRYSELDQYLMGLRPPQEVPPSFAVLDSGLANSRPPQVGITFNGTRLEIPVQDVVKAAGRRKPDATVAQRHFRLAFVMIVEEDADVSPGSTGAAAIGQIDAYRAAFENYFATATDGRGSISTTLRRAVSLSLAPNAGVALGQTGKAVLELERPAAEPVTFSIQAPQGIAGAPASVTVPANAARVEFAVQGLRSGVEELRAIPPDASYHPALARVQVRPQSELRVSVQSGDKQVAAGTLAPIVVRVVDENKLPYSNQPVQVAVSGGGTVNETSLLTDAFGQASVNWTAGPGSFHRLTFSIPGVPGSAGTATALGVPAISPGGVVNGASFAAGIAPGGFASIFGGSLAGGRQAAATSTSFPASLAGVRVLLGGVAVPVTYVSDEQINFVVPGNFPPGATVLSVESALGTSAPLPVQIAPSAPGVFFNTATNAGAVLIAGIGTLTQDRPARPGDYLEIYATGLGSSPTASVTIGNLPAEVVYAGPSSVQGLQQVNVRVPQGVPAGSQTLILTVNGLQTNPVLIQIATGP